jgi:hypothetical protein
MNTKTLIAAGLGLATFACQDNKPTAVEDCQTPSFDAGNFRDTEQDSGINTGDTGQDAGLDTTDASSSLDVEVTDVTDTVQERCALVTLTHDNRYFDIANNGTVIETPEPPTTFNVSPTVEVCPSADTNLRVYNLGLTQAGTIEFKVGVEGDGITDQVQIEVERFSDDRIVTEQCLTEGTPFELTTEGGYITIRTAEGCSN